MWVTENVSREIVFSAADVWRVAMSVLAEEYPGFSITVGRRETPGRFAGGGLGAGIMLVVQDADGYELDYGERVLLEACSQDVRDQGYPVSPDILGEIRRCGLEPFVGQLLPDDENLAVCVFRTHTVGQRVPVHAVLAQ